jgi:hypothetical protein
MNLTSALGAKQPKGSREAGVIWGGIFKKASEAPVEQAVPQFVFELAEGPALEVFEYDAAQQPVGGDSGPAKVFGAKTAAAQFFRGQPQ